MKKALGHPLNSLSTLSHIGFTICQHSLYLWRNMETILKSPKLETGKGIVSKIHMLHVDLFLFLHNELTRANTNCQEWQCMAHLCKKPQSQQSYSKTQPYDPLYWEEGLLKTIDPGFSFNIPQPCYKTCYYQYLFSRLYNKYLE